MVLHGVSLSCYKDHKHATSVSTVVPFCSCCPSQLFMCCVAVAVWISLTPFVEQSSTAASHLHWIGLGSVLVM